MSEPQPIGVRAAAPGGTDVRAAIAAASQKTGIDFQYLLAQARLESALNPNAQASTSSAAGLYQFTGGTWLQTLDKHGADHGLDWAQAAIERGQIRDPQMRAQIMAMRFDPNASALMAAELARDNKADLTATLGREPDAAELYLAHFLGSAGASQLLGALSSDPGQSAASLFPKAAAANRAIFYDAAGAPRSVAGVMDLIRNKMNAQMGTGDSAWAVEDLPFGAVPAVPATPAYTGGPIAREFQATRDAAPPAPARSMAETLRQTFLADGADARGGAPVFVRDAYSRLQRFGL